MQQFKASIFGLGKAGLTLAAVIADAGIQVTGVDINKNWVDRINNSQTTIPEEPGLDVLIKKNINRTLTATTDGAEAVRRSNVHIIIVPLYIDDKKRPNNSNILEAAKVIGSNLKKGDLVVLETTAPVGTTDTILKAQLERNSNLKTRDFYLAHSPERIMTGYSISRFKEFPKVVGGIDKKSTELCAEFYSKFCSTVMKTTDARTAELTKIAEGMYRDVNIAIANELYKICDKYDINFWEVKRSAAHEYCNILDPGIGVGGHCIPVYPHFLILDQQLNGLPMLAKKAREVNDSMAEYIGQKAISLVGSGTVLVVGLTYREGVKELAYTRSKALIDFFKDKGIKVEAVDPLLTQDEVKKHFDIPAADPKATWNKYSCIIVANRESKYLDKLNEVPASKVIDCKNLLKRM